MSSRIAKTQRSRRAMDAKAPKLIENVKSSLGIKGPKMSQLVSDVLKDLHKFKTPHSTLLAKRNITRPFEDVSSVEFLGKVNDASLFSYGSHSKKRPHNIVMGRLFDAQLLDMFEFGINADTFRGMDSFEGIRKAVVRVGSKPAMVFQGDAWDSNADLVVLKNFFLDYFRGEVLPKINLSALDRLIVCTAVDGGVVHFRHYGVMLKKSNNNLPRVEIDEVGPRIDLQLRRRKSASDELVKAALKQPKTVTKAGKNFQKNFGNNAIGDQTARIHMQRQDLANLNVARLKGLKKRKRDDADGADGGVETDGDGMMVDVDSSSGRVASSARSASSSRPSRPASAPSASSTLKKMSGVSTNSMDEFASRSSAASVGSTSSRRAPTVDKNLQRKKAGGFGDAQTGTAYKSLERKKKQKV